MSSFYNSPTTHVDTANTRQLPPSLMALLAVGTAINLVLVIMFGIAMLREEPEPLYVKQSDGDAATDAAT